MGRIFLSHSSQDNAQAIALRQWLTEQNPGLTGEIFLDLDYETGIHTGERWKEALRKANNRCEAVICLLSPRWQASRECAAEYRTAENLGKRIFVARLEPTDTDITREWQRCDLFGGSRTTVVRVYGYDPVLFNAEGLRRLLEGLTATGIGAEHFPWPPPNHPDRSPYRGWQGFDAVDAAVYFGRDTQILRAMDTLRSLRANGRNTILAVLGPSGTGKSSFLRAGLLPRLARDDRHFLVLDPVRPERAALTGPRGLAAALHGTMVRHGLGGTPLGEIKAALPDDVGRLRGWLRETRAAAEAQLLGADPGAAPTLVLPIDQAEELSGTDAGVEGAQLLTLLRELLDDEEGALPLIAVITIRTDRYDAIQTAPELVGADIVEFGLRPIPHARFTDVITGPAARAEQAGARLSVAPDLVDLLLAECAEGADTLPLLALTLARLYQDYGETGTLTSTHYLGMGGLARVVDTEVSSLLSADADTRHAQLELLRDAFVPWLATVDPDSDQPLRRIARWSDLPAAARPLLDAFVEKRLLAKDHRDGETVVEVALESLLRQWDELADWLREHAEDLKAVDTLERAAQAWQRSGHDDSWLLSGVRLVDAETLSAASGYQQRLEPARALLAASRHRENEAVDAENRRRQAELDAALERQQAAERYAAALRRGKGKLRALVVLAVVIAFVAVFGLWRANTARNEAQAESRTATAVRLATEGRSILTAGQHGGDVRALQEMLAAAALAPDDVMVRGAVVDAANQRGRLQAVADAGSDAEDFTLSPGGRPVLAEQRDNGLRFVNAATGATTSDARGGDLPAGAGNVALTWDGARAAGIVQGALRWWNVASGKQIGNPLPLERAADPEYVALSPDGTQIAGLGMSGTSETQETVSIWDTATGKQLAGWVTGDGISGRLAFSRDGAELVTATYADVAVWRIADRQLVAPRIAVRDAGPVALSPDGGTVAVGATQTGAVSLWDVNTGKKLPVDLSGHTGPVTSVAFTAAGDRLYSAGLDQTVRQWDIGSAPPGASAAVPGLDASWKTVFSRDGSRMLTCDVDGNLRLWQVATLRPIGSPLSVHTHGCLLGGLAFTPGGAEVAIADLGGPVRLWNPATGAVADTKVRVADSFALALNPGGTEIAGVTLHGSALLWTFPQGTPIGAHHVENNGGGSGVAAAFSPDGTEVATGGASDDTIRLWNAESGAPIGEPFGGRTGADSIIGLAFSPDGTLLASANSDGLVQLWVVATGQQVGTPFAPYPEVRAVGFDADGKHLLAAGIDAKVHSWPLDRAPELCAKLTANMTHRHWRQWVSDQIPYAVQCPNLPVPHD